MSIACVRVFVGFDTRQPLAAQVAMHSIYKHASSPVSLTPLVLSTLPVKRRGLTDFTYARFLAPYLCDFHGISIFVDSDVLVRGDIAELLMYPIIEPKTPVFVVHGKFKFEFASVMVFNNINCQMLTPLYIENTKINPLAFPWAHTLGELPQEWNHLVGYCLPNPKAKLVHFTRGLPIWDETKDDEFAAEWHQALLDSCRTCSYQELMGKSVHVMQEKVGA